MLGRALFAGVWLLIAAGLVLPFWPEDVAAPGSVTGEVADALVDAVAARGDLCARDRPPPAASGSAEACLRPTVYLVVGPADRLTLPAPLPAI